MHIWGQAGPAGCRISLFVTGSKRSARFVGCPFGGLFSIRLPETGQNNNYGSHRTDSAAKGPAEHPGQADPQSAGNGSAEAFFRAPEQGNRRHSPCARPPEHRPGKAKKLAASDISLAASWRRRRDLNPRAGFIQPTPLAGEPLRPLGYFCRQY